MIIQLEIPKEFAKDYANNRFDDFFRRVYADIDNEGMCGNYEGETAQMMARAFKESRCLDYQITRTYQTSHRPTIYSESEASASKMERKYISTRTRQTRSTATA